MDIAGKQLKMLPAGATSLSIATLPKGVYFLKFYHDAQSYTARIVKL
jgi:hypothetical protein